MGGAAMLVLAMPLQVYEMALLLSCYLKMKGFATTAKEKAEEMSCANATKMQMQIRNERDTPQQQDASGENESGQQCREVT